MRAAADSDPEDDLPLTFSMGQSWEIEVMNIPPDPEPVAAQEESQPEEPAAPEPAQEQTFPLF